MGRIVTMIEVGIYVKDTEELNQLLSDFEVNIENVKDVLNTSSPGEYEVKAIYFGQEFCENLYPSKKEVLEAYDKVNTTGLKFVFVTGILREKQYEEIKSICTELIDKDNVELTINDPGLISEVKGDNVNIGRLRNKQKRLNEPLTLSTLQEENFQHIETKSLCKTYNFMPNSFEIDMVCQGAKTDENINVYFPHTYVTGMRDCPLCESECTKACKTKWIKLGNSPYYQYGNTIFFNNKHLLKLYINKVKRIIFQYGVPI